MKFRQISGDTTKNTTQKPIDVSRSIDVPLLKRMFLDNGYEREGETNLYKAPDGTSIYLTENIKEPAYVYYTGSAVAKLLDLGVIKSVNEVLIQIPEWAKGIDWNSWEIFQDRMVYNSPGNFLRLEVMEGGKAIIATNDGDAQIKFKNLPSAKRVLDVILSEI
jgi:hypothetical protein